MDIARHIFEAVINLTKSKLRSFLAILGILVGTGSVVALITSSQLATEHALAQFKTLGTNLIAMDLRQQDGNSTPQPGTTLTLANVQQLQDASKDIEMVAPYTYLYQSPYYHGKQLDSQALLGADQRLPDVAKIELEQGRMVSDLDKSGFFCVIGSSIAKQLRELGDAKVLGSQLRIGSSYFTIVGILKPWKPNMFLYVEINKGMIIPVKTSFILSKYSQINNLLVRFNKTAQLQDVQNALQAKMAELVPEQNVTFRNPGQIIDVVSKQKATYNYLLIAIGFISLLVGAIGVMNIMLVSVAERRREIGIRMAIGAQATDIMLMFLIEAIVLTLFGGILGILVGLGFSYALAYFSQWEFIFFLMPPLLGFAVSVAVGVVSGFYPAWRASRLDPIDSLRSE